MLMMVESTVEPSTVGDTAKRQAGRDRKFGRAGNACWAWSRTAENRLGVIVRQTRMRASSVQHPYRQAEWPG